MNAQTNSCQANIKSVCSGMRLNRGRMTPSFVLQPCSFNIVEKSHRNRTDIARVKTNYHEKVIKAGLRTMGSSMWLAVTVDMGKIATKSLICQSGGIKLPSERIIMPTMPMRAKSILNLNFLRTLGTSMKKLENSASFAVAPHVMLISNMWARRADETCRERPPRKIASIKVHLKLIITKTRVS